MAEMRVSLRQASRRARYSIFDKTRGGLVSNLGWRMGMAGSSEMKPFDLTNLKKVLVELVFREIDLLV